MPIRHNSALTRLNTQVAQPDHSDKVALTGLLWHGRSDRLFWQVALTNRSFSSNKLSANCVRPTRTNSSTLDPDTVVVTNRIVDMCGLLCPTKYFPAAFLGMWGPNHQPTPTTTHKVMHRTSLKWVSLLSSVVLYLVLNIGELHCISHRPRTMYSFMMLYYLQCNIEIARAPFCLSSGRVSGRCQRNTSGDIWLDMREHTICNNFCPFDSQASEDRIVPYWDPHLWCNPQGEIPEWLLEQGFIVQPNVGVCGQEYIPEDWQITETYQSGIISILTYGTYKTYSRHGKVQYNSDSGMGEQMHPV